MLFKIRSVEILDRLCNLDHFCDRQESKDLKTKCQAMLSPASRIVLKWSTQGLHPQYSGTKGLLGLKNQYQENKKHFFSLRIYAWLGS